MATGGLVFGIPGFLYAGQVLRFDKNLR